MKTLLLFFATVISLLGAPKISLSNRVLNHKTRIEITFDQAMVPADMAGKEIENNLVAVKPAWKTKLKWRSRNIVQLIPQEVPKVATSYQFKLKKGLKAEDGTEVIDPGLAPVSSEKFRCQRHHRIGNLTSGGFVLFFNEKVNAETAAPFFAFQRLQTSKQSAGSIGVQVRQARWGDLSSRYQYVQSWDERFNKEPIPENRAPETEIPHGLVVLPSSPLIVGTHWNLTALPGLPNTAKTMTVSEGRSFRIGNISPFEATSISATTIADQGREIRIHLNQRLARRMTSEDILQHLTITPTPPKLVAAPDRSLRMIKLHGDFSTQDNYQFTLKDTLPCSTGLSLKKTKKLALQFKRLNPGLSLPSHDEAQFAHGSRTYEISSLNHQSLHLRIKKLTPDELVRASQGYRQYTGDGPNNDRIKNTSSLPFALMTGTTVHDEIIQVPVPLDTTYTHKIKWDKFLPEGERFGTFFVSVTGEKAAHEDLKNSSSKIAQSLVQLTDIGLTWKLTGDTAFLYAYSCQTGKALPELELALFGEDAKLLHESRIGEDGLVTLPRKPEHRHLRATLGNDTLLLPYDGNLPTVSMWRFPVNYAWRDMPSKQRKALLFTDRQLYRPGETFHIKGMVRLLEDDQLKLPVNSQPTLQLTDPSGREILNQKVTLSPTGSFDLSKKLPGANVGRYSVTLSWPAELEAADAMEDWWAGRNAAASASFNHSFQVQEFKRNTFDLKNKLTETVSHDLAFELEANYFQGTAVAKGKVDWFLSSSPIGFYPEKHRDFLFGNHRHYDSYYWSHYFGYSDGENQFHDHDYSDNGEANLSDDGKLTLNLSLPSTTQPTPRRATVTSEVTDSNSQTLSTRNSVTVHSSDFYLGISRNDQLARVNEDITFKAIAVAQKGQALSTPVSATLTVHREVNHQTKSKAANGRVIVKNEKSEVLVSTAAVTIEPGNGSFNFTPLNSGKHILTLNTTDATGRPVQTAITQQVYGSDEYSWAYEAGMRIKLVPEQKRYQPGDTARILVLSPIEGEALVTMERRGVIRHFKTRLTLDNPVLEIPLTHEEAPNTFISVLVLKGAANSKRKNPEPQIRLGYCELTIDPISERLSVEVASTKPEARPGETIHITGQVKDFEGHSVSGAEVVFYAEDEGTLAVMGYENPNPIPIFHSPRFLRTENGSSLTNFIPEAVGERYHANKGFIIGGGDGEAMHDTMYEDLRRNFDPCAAWFPTITTNADGSFKAHFPAPDTLTRYRLIAVAHHEASRFGVGTNETIINKPLMLEPSPPAFAHEGDILQPKAILQNTTDHAGTWKVTLQLDSLTGTGEPGSENQRDHLITTVDLAAQGQGTARFDVHFRNTGTAKWIWHAEPVALSNRDLDANLTRELSDSVESTFEVRYPMPLLSEVQFVKLDERRDLLKGFSGSLLEGRGHLELEFARSRLLEAGGAMDYLLHYPYGCVEQTTSSTIPWIAAKNLRHLAPKFQNKSVEQIKRAIQAGADRLLTMQTADGGLAYWPDSRKSLPWASSYGGLGLVMCREAGAEVPSETLDKLALYLSNQLREFSKAKSTYELDSLARTLYVLARLGKAEPPYQAKMLERTDELSDTARAFLALAIHESGQTGAEALLRAKAKSAKDTGYWMRYRSGDAIRLLAWSVISPKSPDCETSLEKLLETRSPRGHWRTTWCNAWSLVAMGAYAAVNESEASEIILTLETPDGEKQITIPKDQPSHVFQIPLQSDLKLFASSSARLYVHSKISAKPKMTPVQPVSKKGLSITRTYERVRADGSSEPLGEPKVGDLVKVTLELALPHENLRYLAIDDPLPSSFQAINTDFASQAGRVKDTASWRVSNREIRTDRVVFFIDHPGRARNIKVTYHARVTHSGKIYAPPAKVEEMYDPSSYALTASQEMMVK